MQLVRCARGGDQQDRRALPDQLLQRLDARSVEGIQPGEHTVAEFEDAVGHASSGSEDAVAEERSGARRQVFGDVLQIVR